MNTKKLALFLAIVLLNLFFFLHLVNKDDSQDQSHAELKEAQPQEADPQEAGIVKSHARQSSKKNLSYFTALNTPREIALESLDLEKAHEEAEKASTHNKYRFAAKIPVDYTPENSGHWERVNGETSQWSLTISSEEALSLNFGFDQYRLPVGAKLTLKESGKEATFRSFTHEDNEEHGQLWTPLIKSDSVEIILEIPNDQLDNFDLHLTSANHQFREIRQLKNQKIGGDISGSCNIDVICSAGQSGVGSLINSYRDQIRSVGAYTVGGVDTCSGALINNTANDNRPFFLTADHCGLNSTNDASVVVYWNFENSSCRTPNSSASGGIGDGDLTQFNTGSIFRATNTLSDFCLIELDDPIAPEVNPYYAGWNRSGAAPTSAVGIHHPAVAEKRISFDLNQTTLTNDTVINFGSAITHIEVTDWDFGTTEGGSSGSPLFDQNGLIVGQLTGGGAACGNNLADIYGRLSISWNSGSTASTRLRDWLDPLGTNATTLAGIDSDGTLEIKPKFVLEQHAGQLSVNVDVNLTKASAQTVSVSYNTTNGTATSGADYIATSGTLSFLPGETTKTLTVAVVSDTVSEDNESFRVLLSNPVNALISSNEGTITITNDDFLPPVFAHPILEGIDQTILPYRDGGDVSWHKDTSVSFDGVDSASSGNVDDNENSSFEFDVTGPATLDFRWRVSSEQDYDFLQFIINGVVISEISGTVNWAAISHALPAGNHVIEFNYIKDFSVSTGSDAGWVDNLTITYPSNDIQICADIIGANMVIDLTGVPNTLYTLYRSTDLTSWSSITDLITDGTGTTSYSAPISSTDSKVFYRAEE